MSHDRDDFDRRLLAHDEPFGLPEYRPASTGQVVGWAADHPRSRPAAGDDPWHGPGETGGDLSRGWE